MPKVVFRVAKLKHQGNVGDSLGHNHRLPGEAEKSWAHADPKRQHLNVTLVAPEPVPVAEIVRRKTGKPPRKNAVLATEIMISASPEYFRPGNKDAKGTWDEGRLKAWRDAMEPWIAERFPHAISVVLHLDEDTPHYHVLDVPLVDDPKTGGLKLGHKLKFGGEKRRDMERWQTWAHEPVAHLGIERGERGSPADHEPPYKWRNDHVGPAGPVEVQPPPMLLTPKARADWADAETARLHAAMKPVVQAARGRKVAERKEKEAVRKGAIARERARHLEAERDELKRQLKVQKDLEDQMRELDQLRRVKQALDEFEQAWTRVCADSAYLDFDFLQSLATPIAARYGVQLAEQHDGQTIMAPPQAASARQIGAALYRAIRERGWECVIVTASDEVAAVLRDLAREDGIADRFAFVRQVSDFNKPLAEMPELDQVPRSPKFGL